MSMRRLISPTHTLFVNHTNSHRGTILRLTSSARSTPSRCSLRNFTMTSAVEKKVNDLINNHAVQVFSKTYCPFCEKVKGLFSNLSVPFNVTELDDIPDGDAIQDYLAKKTGQRTVPSVFVNKKHLGGCDATYALHNQQKLTPLLKEAGLNPKA